MSNYPVDFDNEANLMKVRDFQTVYLAEDYAPGDTSITIEGDISGFPDHGLITLVEQCSEMENRAISFRYGSRTDVTFDELTLVEDFTDVPKEKRVTSVVMSLMAEHHNEIKDAILSMQAFVGKEGEVSSTPLAGTMEARVNYLQGTVLKPKAWFVASKTIGKAPLTVTLSDESTRQVNTWIWDFGDSSSQTIVDSTSGTTTHTFSTPDKYDITLTVENEFGEDTLTVPEMITVRTLAPDEAELTFFPTAYQTYLGSVLHSRNNQLISLEVSDDGEQSLDPITSYTWEFGDDLTHPSSIQASAYYHIGGLYDAKLRVDTTLGSYRITTFPSVINITEQVNLWMFLFDPLASDMAITKDVMGYEFGLISESFKAGSPATMSVTRDHSFLSGESSEDQQIREFRRNNGFAARSLVASGDQGTAMLYWSEGGATAAATQNIRFAEYNGFSDTWITPDIGGSGSAIQRRWNWVSFNTPSAIYFQLGTVYPFSLGSPTNQLFEGVDLGDLSLTATSTWTSSNYANGADELLYNVGEGLLGDFSVYRTAWKDSNGYLVRNDGVGSYFRLKSFYMTEGTLSEPIQSIRKLNDMPGNTKLEGILLSMTNGVYFFNNSGEVVVYNPSTSTWASGGPGVNSNAFSALQDHTVEDFDSTSQPLMGASDGERTAFLSYDYSVNAFIKFNESDLTFTSLPQRPSGEQFVMGVF